MKVLYENGIPCGIDWELIGEIKKGDKLVWEPLNEQIKTYLEVTKVLQIDNENYYHLLGEDDSFSINSESCVRESCVRDFRGINLIPVKYIYGGTE